MAELIVDNFAGGGGASTGIEMALGRSPDVAINHDREALALHAANHPHTRHYASDVFEIDPKVATRNRKVGLAWFSPDCKHFSKAKGAQPVSKRVRGLAWVVTKWAAAVRPRVIILENVEEFQDWGPVIRKVGTDGFPLFDVKGRPWYVPCTKRKGRTFRTWVRKLERLGYRVEWRQLRACDFGAPTVRKRLFLIARCDGKPIVWPEPTHGCPKSEAVKNGERQPWRTAAEIIDWSLPCPSIFLTPEEAREIGCRRPLMPATMNRIAAGVKRYVLDAASPFIVPITHTGGIRVHSLDEPVRTVTAAQRGELSLITPFVSTYYGAKAEGECRGSDLAEPLRTQGTENRFGLVAPFTVPRYSEAPGQAPRCASIEVPVATVVPDGNGASLVAPFLASPAHSTTTGRGPNVWPAQEPLRTQTASNDKVVVAAHLQRQFGRSDVTDAEKPAPTVMPGGGGKTAVVAAFLAQHNGGMVGHQAEKPLSTLTQRATQQQVVAATLVTNTTGHAATEIGNPAPTLTTGGQQMLAASLLSPQRGSNVAGGGGDVLEPVPCLTAGGNHVAEVRAFLMKYYGTDQDPQLEAPLHTITTKDRFGVVTVEGVDYEIVDIGMRMLTPRELYLAQGFPESYIINPLVKRFRRVDVGKRHKTRTQAVKKAPLTKTAQVRMCGNSVCPPLAAALVRANVPELGKQKQSRQRELVGV